MSNWELNPVRFKFQLSDLTLIKPSIPMESRVEQLSSHVSPVEVPLLPTDKPAAGSQGFCIRNLPISVEQPKLTRRDKYLCYVPTQYSHCYIDLEWTFEQYVGKFSSKTRSTIQRKIKKYKEHCGGNLDWRSYTTPEQVREFHQIAREVSKLTYQERLLDVGLPNTDAFVEESAALAGAGNVRAYLLFNDGKPVSYLYCPAENDVLIYAYLGFDPAYQNLSVGTVLQWLAIEQIFAERRFKFFDFTEGNSTHKQLFASHQRLCANVFFVLPTLRNKLIIRSHILMTRFSKFLGDFLKEYGLKTKIKKLLRGT
jgi:CelD/BcsL family acetyltransferase involved in cellulose biosynthesis